MDYRKALQCAVLSKEAYLDFSPELRFSAFPELEPELIEGPSTDTQCIILKAEKDNNPDLFIVFRGSDSNTDWGVNLNIRQAAVQFFKKETVKEEIQQNSQKIYPYPGKSQSGTMLHQGFAQAYGAVRDAIHRYLRQHPGARVTVTGHSLGGAVATLCAVDVQYNFGGQLAELEVYTFGSPRVGNKGFQKSFHQRVPRSYRFVQGMDLVPAFPRVWQGYRHTDHEYRIGQRVSWDFIVRRFRDHAIVKYIAALKEQVDKNAGAVRANATQRV